MIYDVIIIGAGPAGLTAAIYTGRNRLKTLVLSTDLGGQTALADEMWNYPGFNAIKGIDLVEKIKAQAELQETVAIQVGLDQAVKNIASANNVHTVTTEKGESYQAKTLIITAGKKPRELNVPGEKENIGRGVSYCATCDGPLFRNKFVAVIGGGNSATKAAQILDQYANQIYILAMKDYLGGERILIDKIQSSPKIKIILNTQTTAITSDGQKVSGLTYKDAKTGESKQLKVDGVFIEIGSVPNTQIVGNTIKLNEKSEIIIDENNMTSVPGIFGAGDITSVKSKQTVIAAGEGAKAAMAVYEYLANSHI